MKKLLIAILATLTLAVQPVSASYSNDPTTVFMHSRHNAQPVDQQTWCGDCVGPGESDYTIKEPWTVNPGWLPGYTPPIALPAVGGTSDRDEGCMWDSDDWFRYESSGNVFPPNTTLTMTECRWANTYSPYGLGGSNNLILWYSTSPDLVFTVRWEWEGGFRTYTLPAPIRSGNQYEYRACLLGPPAWGGTEIAVPNSHDGHGVYQLETITITNPTNRKTSKTGGFITTDYRGIYAYCPNGFIEV